ncbi:hypothetical protein F8388_012023 [Cannabis sativa]|uniref:Bulb-type lectin domain-containing protein n=1 Tax=Cannabis sativa TaxID=3483 RepID=A0A7J6GDT8_CANSA|nr:hypothetical protein F8388_012023 [Cannabis sativa]
MEFPSFLVTLLVVLSLFSLSTTTFTIRPSEILRDNNNTAILVSQQGTFGLGFFTPQLVHQRLVTWEFSTTKLQSNNRVVVWSTNSSKQAREPLVQLLDDGMILGWDLKRGLNRRLSSWKSSDDPCHGDLT